MQQDIVFIGGQPKGFPEPFSLETKSGQVLRKIVQEAGLLGHAIYFDLWENEEQEKKGEVSQETFNRLAGFCLEGKQLVALGQYQQEALDFCMAPFGIISLPHPGSRDFSDITKLELGIRSLVTHPTNEEVERGITTIEALMKREKERQEKKSKPADLKPSRTLPQNTLKPFRK